MSTKYEAILCIAGTLDPTGNVYTTEALQSLADRFPKKLRYQDGRLISLVEFDDKQHRSRMMASVSYHMEQQVNQEAREKRSAKCTNKAVEETDRGFRLYCYHPQWGGYSSHAEVEFDRKTDTGPGCFELSVYHDGDFPSDGIEFQRHCCAADQFIRFGLNVLEAQLSHQVDAKNQPVRLDAAHRSVLEEARDRIGQLLLR